MRSSVAATPPTRPAAAGGRGFARLVRTRHRRRGGPESGFTMIEILLVLVIIAMAATLVGPAIDSGLRAREVRSAARTLAAAMRSLQGDAIRTGQVQTLLIDPMDNQLQVANRGQTVELGGAAQIGQMVGGEIQPNGVVRVNFYPNGSTSGVSVLVGEKGGAAREGFVVRADPLIGLVTIRDAQAR